MFQTGIRLPAEWEPHSCCWMAWAVHREWGAHADQIKRELHEIISTIALYEPVRLLTPPDQIADAKSRGFGGNVDIVPAPVDDIWMRDIAPTFALRGDEVVAIDWNFNGWGSTPERRSRPGDRLAGLMAAEIGVPVVHAPFIAEGGAIATDGEGTICTTKSCLLNPNRNLPLGRNAAEQMAEIEKGFSALGGKKIIWLEGDAGEPITSGHVDGYVLFSRPGAILVEASDPKGSSDVNRAADVETLCGAKDQRGRSIQIIAILPPRQTYWKFSTPLFMPCYLNAYVTSGAVVTAKYGDPERDEAARRTLQSSFPNRAIQMITMDHIVNGGGGVHCLTQPMPISKPSGGSNG
jgi:agmatine deiminase